MYMYLYTLNLMCTHSFGGIFCQSIWPIDWLIHPIIKKKRPINTRTFLHQKDPNISLIAEALLESLKNT